VHETRKPLLRLNTLLLSAALLFEVCAAEATPSPALPSHQARSAPDCKAQPMVKAGRCKVDHTPDAFSFATRTKAAPGTWIESEAVTISGINVPVVMTIHGGEYSIDGGAYRKHPGTVRNGQQVLVRVRSSPESSGIVSAKLRIGTVSRTFTVKTVNYTGRVEAEAAMLEGAVKVSDPAASEGKAAQLGHAGSTVSIVESLDARVLIMAYRTDTAGTLDATVNGKPVGRFTLRPTAGGYATSSVFGPFKEGDVITITSTSVVGSPTRIDFVEFAASPFRAVSTLASKPAWAMDGLTVGPDGNVYLSGAQQILRMTPAGELSVLASGLGSGNDSGFDSLGNLYVADYQGSAVHKLTPAGVLTTFASGLDGPAGIWVDHDDNVLVTLYGANFSGTGATVLSIAPDGVISTYASGGPLQDVVGIVGDEHGQVYASNYSSGVIFNITGGNVSLLAETGTGANQLCYSRGAIYVPSLIDDQIRRVSLDGTVTHFAGTSVRQTIDGPLATASFLRPSACDFAEDGTVLYVLDWESGLIRKIDSGQP
jgi:hypothetical protein